ncbi:MAG TPA: hypothetical protein VKQ29_02335 [Aliidongia sp.]|nr:hypothetical protein [Aliidongia sp.]
MSGDQMAPAAGVGAFDAAIGQASTLGQLEALAGLTSETRIDFWLAYAGIENEGERLAAGIAELKRRIRRTGMMA